jgi:hypothetical protein
MVLPTNCQTHGNLGASVARARIETDTVTAGRAVHLDLARVRLEASSGVFSGDTALNGEATAVDVLLGETELLKSDASGDLDLRGNNVDAGDLLCEVSAKGWGSWGSKSLTGDGVLDLNTRVDLDKVVAVLLVDEELGGTGVAVLDSVGELEGVGEDGLTDRLVEVRSGGDLNDLNRKRGIGRMTHLLVPTLDRAVTLEEVNTVALCVSEQLDLDVPGLLEEACRCQRGERDDRNERDELQAPDQFTHAR